MNTIVNLLLIFFATFFLEEATLDLGCAQGARDPFLPEEEPPGLLFALLLLVLPMIFLLLEHHWKKPLVHNLFTIKEFVSNPD